MKGMAKRENDVMVASTDEFAGSESVVIDSITPVEDKVIVTPPPSKTSKEETVMIRLNKNHKCHIGGVYYVFEKLKAYPVPPNVKRVLQQAGLLTAL